MIMTVAGPMRADSVSPGACLVCEHLVRPGQALKPQQREELALTNLATARRDQRSFHTALDSNDDAVFELSRFIECGGALVLEGTSVDDGRDAPGLRKVSILSGVPIVMGATCSMNEKKAEWTAESAAAEFMRQLHAGIDAKSKP